MKNPFPIEYALFMKNVVQYDLSCIKYDAYIMYKYTCMTNKHCNIQ